MFFKGLFLSLISFGTILCISSLISAIEFRFSRLTLSLLPILGFLFLFAALWSAYLSLSVLLCSGALTCFYAASRLKKRCRCCSAVRPQYRKK